MLFLDRDRRAGLLSACFAPPLCPDRDGQAGLPSACGAPPRVVVSRVLSPCRLFSLVPLFCVCLDVGWVLAGALFYPPPPRRAVPGGCRRCAAVLLFSPCLLVSAVGRLRAVATAGRAPPLPPPGLVLVSLLRASCFLFSRAHAACCPCSPPALSAPCLQPHPSWSVLRGCSRPAARFSLCARCLFAAALRLVCRRASALPVALTGRLSPPGLCFAGGASLPFLLALPAFFIPSVCQLFALGSAPPPPFCLSLFPGRCRPCCLAFLRAVSGGPGCGVPCHVAPCFVVPCLWCGAALHCFGLPCAVWCPSVLCGAAASDVAPCVLLWRAAVFSAVRLGLLSCCAPCYLCCVLLCRTGLFFCVLCCVASLGAVLRCVAFVVACLAVLLCTEWSAWCCVAFSRSFGCCSLLCCALGCCPLCCVLCCDVLCCCLLCCVSGSGVLVHCAVLFALCCAVVSGSAFLCAVLCLLALSCAVLRLVVPCGAVLLCTVLCAWRCVAFSRAFGCRFVLCPALGCCAVLWGAVPFGASLRCVALCCVRCAVCVLLLCCGVCSFLWLSVVLRAPLYCPAGCALSSVHCQKQKNCFPCIFRNSKTVSRWCLALCTLSSLHAAIPHTEKTSLINYLFLRLGLTPLDTRSKKEGKHDEAGAEAGGEGTWRAKKGGRERVQGRIVLAYFLNIFYGLP